MAVSSKFSISVTVVVGIFLDVRLKWIIMMIIDVTES